MMSGEKLREVEPVLKKEILGGAYFPEGATCDPHRFVLEMAKAAEKLGARILVGHKVTEVLNRDTQITGIRLKVTIEMSNFWVKELPLLGRLSLCRKPLFSALPWAISPDLLAL
jgi:glycine/D-amino acid oxidase-like deaminating enzyme